MSKRAKRLSFTKSDLFAAIDMMDQLQDDVGRDTVKGRILKLMIDDFEALLHGKTGKLTMESLIEACGDEIDLKRLN